MIKAKYAGRCKRCLTRFDIGTPLEKINGDWLPVDCPVCKREKETLRLMIEAEKRMETEYHVAFGVLGIPAGCRATMSPREWIEAALEVGVIDQEQAQKIRAYWGSYVNMALDD